MKRFLFLFHILSCIYDITSFRTFYLSRLAIRIVCLWCWHVAFSVDAVSSLFLTLYCHFLFFLPLSQVCPICAASPGGDPNHVTDDFIAHLTLEHRMPRDSEETGNARHLRRMFHPGRGLGSRSRRNMHFGQGSGLSSGGPMSSSPNSRDAMDPIAGES